MNYIENFNFYGVEAKEIPCIKGNGAPTNATEGAVGLFYMNTDNGDVYKCVSAENSAYTWESIGAGNDANIIGTTYENKIKQFSLLLNNTDAIESFLFFTDPHLVAGTNFEKTFKDYMETVKTYYNSTPTSFVLCGGDWLNSGDTYEQACFKLGYIDSFMRSNFNKYYPIMGNHDTNYQGVDNTGAANTGTLTTETIRNLMFRENGNTYYSFDGINTKFYVFDSGLDRETTMDDYRWQQIEWLGASLSEDDAEHSAIGIHIVYEGGVSSGRVWDTEFMTNITLLSQAYNNHSTIILNEKEYDFTNCTGTMEFVIGGHTHLDHTSTLNGIPLIATTNVKYGNVSTFDLCVADYDNKKLHLVRVGTGENRTIDLIGNSKVIETLEGAYVTSAPSFSTYTYTETASSFFQVRKQSTIPGGTLKVTYDNTKINDFEIRLFLFDSNGNPYQHTGVQHDNGEFVPTTVAILNGDYEHTDLVWFDPNTGNGHSTLRGQSSISIPDDCTVLVSLRFNTLVTGDTTDFPDGTITKDTASQWAFENVVVTVEH